MHFLGRMLERVYLLRKEIADFMELQNKPVPEFRDPQWISHLAFLVDITTELNKLNTKLQGSDQFVFTLLQHITAFQNKLRLWISQLERGNYIHFPKLAENSPRCGTSYVQVLRDLQEEFLSRFADVKKHKENFDVFGNPFTVEVDSAPELLQMELIDIQANNELRAKFDSESLDQFYRKYLDDEHFPALFTLAKKMACIFGSTYRCEQLFSQMNLMKTKLRSRLNDCNLENSLRLATSKSKPDIEAMCREKQHQISH